MSTSQHIAQVPTRTINRQLDFAAKSKTNLFIWGPPGIGKSAIVRQFADDRCLPSYPGYKVKDGICYDPEDNPCTRPWFVDLRLSQVDPVELAGVPYVTGNRTCYAAPHWWPDFSRPVGVIFLDELPQAPVANQNAALEPCGKERSLRGYVLPPGWIIVAAGNRITDRAGAGRITTALADRFAHVELVVSWDDWRDWAFSAGINLDVLAWLSFKKGSCLYDFDPSKAQEELVFASPRSWETVASLLTEGIDADLRFPTFSGIIGRGQAAELCAFLEIKDKIQHPASILAAPLSAQVPGAHEPGVLYATITGLCQHVDKTTAENFMTYISRLSKEWSVLAMEFACGLPQVGPLLRSTAGWTSWFLQHGALMGNAA